MFRITDEGEIMLTRGDSAEFPVNIATLDDEPYEFLDGDSITFSVREIPDATSPLLLSKTFAEPYIRLLPEDTRGMEVGKYSFDIQFDGADGSVITVFPDENERTAGRVRNRKNFVLCSEVTISE